MRGGRSPRVRGDHSPRVRGARFPCVRSPRVRGVRFPCARVRGRYPLAAVFVHFHNLLSFSSITNSERSGERGRERRGREEGENCRRGRSEK